MNVEKLECKKDNREEALSHDKHLVGVFKRDETLVDHVPIEISRIIDYFMQNNEKNFVSATVVGLRKREIGLVVPAKFSAYAADRRVADLLSKKILKLKQSALNLIFNMKKIKSFVKGLIY